MHSWNRRHSRDSRHHHFPLPISEPFALVVDLGYSVSSATIGQQLRPSVSPTHHFAHPIQRMYRHTISSFAIFATVRCRYDDRIHHDNAVSIPSDRQGAAEAIKEILSFFADSLVFPARSFLQPSNSGVGSDAQCSCGKASNGRSRVRG